MAAKDMSHGVFIVYCIHIPDHLPAPVLEVLDLDVLALVVKSSRFREELAVGRGAFLHPCRLGKEVLPS